MAGPAVLLARAVASREAGHYPEAIRRYRAALAAAPDDATILYQLGTLLTQTGRAGEATPLLRRALAIGGDSPTLRHALALTLLAAGDYAEGWPLYHRRYEVPELWSGPVPALPYPRWRGEEVAGKRIAVLGEAGIGDQIQFARFLPELKRRGAEVTAIVHPALARLFAARFAGIEVLTAAGAVTFADPDYWTLSSDLAGDLGVTPDMLSGAPYLAAPAPAPPAPCPRGPRIGIKTGGDAAFVRDAARSLGPADIALLRARLPGTIVSLDPADSGAKDFTDTAAIVAGLDAVVSVDTSVAHLAGAIGVPCLMLIPGFAADWRWLEGRATSPWYDSVRLYRGALRGGWREAIGRLCDDLRSRS